VNAEAIDGCFGDVVSTILLLISQLTKPQLHRCRCDISFESREHRLLVFFFDQRHETK
ncbi:unnamed protein product, partial [Musa acuminata subsp. burmannicoides]